MRVALRPAPLSLVAASPLVVALTVALVLLASGASAASPARGRNDDHRARGAGDERAAAAAVPVYAGLAVRGGVVPALATAIGEDLRRQFAARGARVIVQAERQTVVERQTRDLGQMDAQLDDAARALADSDVAAARALIGEGLAIFEEALAFSEDDATWARYREALLLLATVAAADHDDQGADAALLQLLAVDPNWKPRRGALPAALVQRFEFVRDEARATPPAPLEVKSRPPDAHVLVDGRRAGRAPVAVEVIPGVHYVLVEHDSRIARERVVVTAAGGRVTARLGSPEMEAAAALVRRLRAPATTKKELVEAAWDVADTTLCAVVVPWGKAAQVFIGRLREGSLDIVVGATVPAAEASREQAVFDVVEAALSRPGDTWVAVKSAPAGDAAKLRESLLQGQGDIGAAAVVADLGAPFPTSMVVGGIVGGVVLVGGAALAVIAYLGAEDEKSRGFRYRLDGSGLE